MKRSFGLPVDSCMLHGKQPWSFRHIRLTLTRAVYFDEQMIPGRQPHFRVSRRGLSGKFWPSPRKTSAWKSSQPGAGVQRAPRTASSSSRESERGRITHPPAPNRGNAGWLHPTPIPQRLESASKNSGRLVVVRAPQRQKPRRRTRTLWPGGTRVAVPQLPSEATPGEGGGDSGGAAAPAAVRTDGRRRDQLGSGDERRGPPAGRADGDGSIHRMLRASEQTRQPFKGAGSVWSVSCVY
jgi:hypothetical protein